jgi:trk system potassium uptake protein TrkA
VGRKVADIKLPKGATIGAIVRGLPTAEGRGLGDDGGQKTKSAAPNADAQVLIAHHDTVIETGDHVILFVINKKLIHQVEELFQVGVGFL